MNCDVRIVSGIFTRCGVICNYYQGGSLAAGGGLVAVDPSAGLTLRQDSATLRLAQPASGLLAPARVAPVCVVGGRGGSIATTSARGMLPVQTDGLGGYTTTPPRYRCCDSTAHSSAAETARPAGLRHVARHRPADGLAYNARKRSCCSLSEIHSDTPLTGESFSSLHFSIDLACLRSFRR